ncbi:MAG: hypothetical protein WKF37_22165 [Bryobacteraceae bacterium]
MPGRPALQPGVDVFAFPPTAKEAVSGGGLGRCCTTGDASNGDAPVFHVLVVVCTSYLPPAGFY